MPGDAASRFESTEAYYADYRPGYGERAIRHLVERFALDARSRVLDLGCGTGQVALALAPHAGTVLGMDPDRAMLREARERAEAAELENLSWVASSDAELDGVRGPLRLATMGRSFHWTDQQRTLDRLHDLAEPGGGVALLDDEEWLTRGTREWQAVVHETAARCLDDLPERTGPVEYDDPWDELVASRGFRDVDRSTFEVEREWSVESAVGYVFSLSFCSPATFGDDRATFEADLRERLRERGGGPFRQDATVTVISGRR